MPPPDLPLVAEAPPVGNPAPAKPLDWSEFTIVEEAPVEKLDWSEFILVEEAPVENLAPQQVRQTVIDQFPDDPDMQKLVSRLMKFRN